MVTIGKWQLWDISIRDPWEWWDFYGYSHGSDDRKGFHPEMRIIPGIVSG